MSNCINQRLEHHFKKYLFPRAKILIIAGEWFSLTEDSENHKNYTIDSIHLSKNTTVGKLGSGRFGGTDMSVSRLDHSNYPIENNTYDIILNSNVLEHCYNPFLLVQEWSRVCKTGGRVISIAPFIEKRHGSNDNMLKTNYKTMMDAWRFLPDGMNLLYEQASLKMEDCGISSEGMGKDEKGKIIKLDNLPKTFPLMCTYAVGIKLLK